MKLSATQTIYRASQNYVNTYIVETIYSQNINHMCKMIYRTVLTAGRRVQLTKTSEQQ
jgi:hypothetical protein